ncbi:hypothetical protein C8035_v010468 [Colletotrichum spinosum]|uniref:Uncharacterized protein n=1 Tax=Colletotrichum spinosum TaxID=1347390 RepID=A0A4R8PPF3_9PEZI|nr:hypothetical protein C8035_v010468 [Colletotrichum spinosum]
METHYFLTLLTLPNEILEIISDDVHDLKDSPRSIVSLSLACRRLYPFATLAIYKTVRAVWHDDLPAPAARICYEKNTASLVRHLLVRFSKPEDWYETLNLSRLRASAATLGIDIPNKHIPYTTRELVCHRMALATILRAPNLVSLSIQPSVVDWCDHKWALRADTTGDFFAASAKVQPSPALAKLRSLQIDKVGCIDKLRPWSSLAPNISSLTLKWLRATSNAAAEIRFDHVTTLHLDHPFFRGFNIRRFLSGFPQLSDFGFRWERRPYGGRGGAVDVVQALEAFHTQLKRLSLSCFVWPDRLKDLNSSELILSFEQFEQLETLKFDLTCAVDIQRTNTPYGPTIANTCLSSVVGMLPRSLLSLEIFDVLGLSRGCNEYESEALARRLKDRCPGMSTLLYTCHPGLVDDVAVVHDALVDQGIEFMLNDTDKSFFKEEYHHVADIPIKEMWLELQSEGENW